MRIIVGLGNPGAKYERTRHNAGFRAVRAFHTLHAAEFGGWSRKFEAEISEGRIGNEKVVLLLPQTFMNLSGDAVGNAAGFWHVEAKDIIVVYDELDVPLGTLRLRATGSAGGHNGMKSIITRLGTPDVPRMRMGIGSERAAIVPAEDFVLEKFSADEEIVLANVISRTVQALEVTLAQSLDAASNQFGK